MSKQERYMKQGMLKELREQLIGLENRAENHVAAIQTATFVYESPLDLDGGNVVAAAQDLQAVLQTAAKVRGRVEQLEDELGL